MSVTVTPLTIRQMLDVNVARCNRWHSVRSWSPLEWAGAMAGEAGEACNAAKKLKRVEDRIPNINEEGRHLATKEAARKHILREVADTFIYGVLLASRCEATGEELEAIIREVFNKKSEEYGFPERL